MKRDWALGHLMFMGLGGESLTRAEKSFICEHQIGGVILFRRNIKDEQQVKALCQSLKELSQGSNLAPLFIAIDMEGGRVHRLPREKFKAFPSMAEVAKYSCAEKKQAAFDLGCYLMDLGINLNFAPCLDILTQPKNELIGDRSFGGSAQAVIKSGRPFIEGLTESGILFCGKHFPGHGDTLVDSHFELPVCDLSLDVLEQRELAPFKQLARELPMLMTAHILYQKLDPKRPITLSQEALPQLLKKCDYQGVVTSDDLEMQAISKHYPESVVPYQALSSGCDMIMYCNDLEAPGRVLAYLENDLLEKRLLAEDVHKKSKRIALLKQKWLS